MVAEMFAETLDNSQYSRRLTSENRRFTIRKTIIRGIN
jgi:hypothetical protein